jgi:hypothetical protein
MPPAARRMRRSRNAPNADTTSGEPHKGTLVRDALGGSNDLCTVEYDSSQNRFSEQLPGDWPPSPARSPGPGSSTSGSHPGKPASLLARLGKNTGRGSFRAGVASLSQVHAPELAAQCGQTQCSAASPQHAADQMGPSHLGRGSTGIPVLGCLVATRVA